MRLLSTLRALVAATVAGGLALWTWTLKMDSATPVLVSTLCKPGETETKCRKCDAILLHKLQGRIVRCPCCQTIARYTSGLTSVELYDVQYELWDTDSDVRTALNNMYLPNLAVKPSVEAVTNDLRLIGFARGANGKWSTVGTGTPSLTTNNVVYSPGK